MSAEDLAFWHGVLSGSVAALILAALAAIWAARLYVKHHRAQLAKLTRRAAQEAVLRDAVRSELRQLADTKAAWEREGCTVPQAITTRIARLTWALGYPKFGGDA